MRGIAAKNAKLAAFGGGPKALGGGGKALGGAAVKVAVIGPAMLVVGLAAAAQGEKAKTQAARSAAEVTEAVGQMGETRVALAAVRQRVRELKGLLHDLIARATAALDHLESDPFDPERHGDRFQNAVAMAVAVRDVAATPVVDTIGALSEDTATLVVKYRAFLKEAVSE